MLLGELSTFNNIHIFTPKHFLDLDIITKFLLKVLESYALISLWPSSHFNLPWLLRNLLMSQSHSNTDMK